MSQYIEKKQRVVIESFCVFPRSINLTVIIICLVVNFNFLLFILQCLAFTFIHFIVLISLDGTAPFNNISIPIITNVNSVVIIFTWSSTCNVAGLFL